MSNEEITNKGERDKDFLVLSCFAGLFIVAGHVGAGSDFMAMRTIPLYTFHVPLFVFIAGYFFKDNRTFVCFIKRKFTRLILPYYLAHFVYMALNVFLANYGFRLIRRITAYRLLMEPLFPGAGALANFNSPGWFVMPLLYIELMAFVFSRLPIKNKKAKLCFEIAVSLLLGSAAVILSRRGIYVVGGRKSKYLVTLLQVFSMFPYFYLGTMYKMFFSDRKLSLDIRLFIMAGIMLCFVAISLAEPKFWSIHPMNYKFLRFSRPPVTYFMGTLGILFWMQAAKILSPALGSSKVVKVVGENTFSMMLHQYLGFFCVNAFGVCLYKWAGIGWEDPLKVFMQCPHHPVIKIRSMAILHVYGGGVIIPLIIHQLYAVCKNKMKLFLGTRCYPASSESSGNS